MSSQKRISAPKTFMIKRKEKKWVFKTSPGPHNKKAIPITVLLRDVAKIALNANEVKTMLKEGKILINGIKRKSLNFPVGFMDSLSVPLIKKYFRIVYDKSGRLKNISIPSSEAGLKLERINKKMIKGKEYQLTMHDGSNFMVKASEGKKYKTGDSLLIKIPGNEIVKHLPFSNGSSVFITGGAHAGKTAVLKESKNKIIITIGKEDYDIIKEYVFITGEKKSELKLE